MAFPQKVVMRYLEQVLAASLFSYLISLIPLDVA
jgi:hypothetical protein